MITNEYPEGIKTGWYLYFQKKIYHITELEAGGKMVIQNLDNSSEIHFTTIAAVITDDSNNDENPVLFASELEILYEQIEALAPLPETSELRTISQTIMDRAKEIVQTIEEVRQYLDDELRRAISNGAKGHFRKEAALRIALSRISPERQIKKTQYYHYLNLYNKHDGNARKIAASLIRANKGKTKLSKQALHLCDTIILLHYVRSRAMSKSATFQELFKAWQRTQGYWINPDKCKGNIPNNVIDELLDPKIPITIILENPEKAVLLSKIELPSKSWFIKYVSWFESHPERGRAVINQRYGKDHWENYYEVLDSFVHKAAYPRHIYVLDHWLIDIFSVDEKDPTKVFRLWATVSIDLFSRAVPSLTLSEEDPNIEAVQENLLHMIWPKNVFEELGIEADWVMYGIPLTLSLDNAWAHHSHSLEALARDISQKGKYDSITLLWRPPYKARYGNVIERFIGNLSVKIKAKFAGAGAILSSNSKDVGIAKEEAIFTPKDVYRFLYQEIVQYNHTPHSSLGGMTPHEKWLEGIQAVGEPVVPPLTDRMKRYFLRLYPEPKTITQKGVGIFGMHYIGPELSGAEKIDLITGKKIEYRVRYTKKDISVIYLFREDVFVADLKAKERMNPDGSVRPLSWADRELGQKRAKVKGKKAGQWLEEVSGFDDINTIDELKEVRKKEKEKFIKSKNKPPKAPKLSDAQKAQQALSSMDSTDATNDTDDLLRGFLNKGN